jgi:dihydropyrimidinase
MEKQLDLLLVGGTVVTGEGIQCADVGVRGETIAAVEPNLAREAAREVIDVTGRYVFPGVIDAHVHPVYLDSVEDCSRIAAYGGTTTLIHYAYARTGDSLLQKAKEMLEDGLAHSRLDFCLHGGMFEAPKQLQDVPKVFEMGIRTFKFFMPYIKQGWTPDDYHLIKGMDILADLGGMAMVHAENGGAIDYMEDKYLTGPDASAKYFNVTRPAAMEEEAIFRAIRMAEVM